MWCIVVLLPQKRFFEQFWMNLSSPLTVPYNSSPLTVPNNRILYGCFVFDLGCFVFEFWVLRFRDLGVFVFDLGCFVFEIWVLLASVFVCECFVFETTVSHDAFFQQHHAISQSWQTPNWSFSRRLFSHLCSGKSKKIALFCYLTWFLRFAMA